MRRVHHTPSGGAGAPAVGRHAARATAAALALPSGAAQGEPMVARIHVLIPVGAEGGGHGAVRSVRAPVRSGLSRTRLRRTCRALAVKRPPRTRSRRRLVSTIPGCSVRWRPSSARCTGTFPKTSATGRRSRTGDATTPRSCGDDGPCGHSRRQTGACARRCGSAQRRRRSRPAAQFQPWDQPRRSSPTGAPRRSRTTTPPPAAVRPMRVSAKPSLQARSCTCGRRSGAAVKTSS